MLGTLRGLAAVIVGLLSAVPVAGQVIADPVPEVIGPGLKVRLVDVAVAPSSSSGSLRAPIRYAHHAGDGSGRLFVADGHGLVHILEDGAFQTTPYFDAAAMIGSAYTGLSRDEKLGSFAFHPDYADPTADGYGLFYTATLEAMDSSTPTFDSARPDGGGVYLNVVSEWRVDPNDPARIANNRRIVLSTIQMHVGHHIDQVAFDPTTESGDPDHGLLFIGLGDGGRREYPPRPPDPYDSVQNLAYPTGAILRIDPLGTDSGNGQYGVPTSNPFASDGDAATLGEIFAYGFRNPQRFSFDTVTGKLLVGDIGESNVDEVNLLTGPGNFGWPLREGVFMTDRDDFSVVLPLPPGDTGFEYPVVQLDRDESTSPLMAISGGFVYRGSSIPDLYGHYVFGELVSGRVFHVPLDDLVAGTQVIPQELLLEFGGQMMTLLEIVQAAAGDPSLTRTDLRFGLDEAGEIYLVTKRDGVVRTLAAVPTPGAGAIMGVLVLTLTCAARRHRRSPQRTG